MNKTILILGGDGYLGWPLSMKLALQHPDRKIIIVDNLWRRETVRGMGFDPMFAIPTLSMRTDAFYNCYGVSNLHYRLLDICSAELEKLIDCERPDTIYHLAQQCSAPYSMADLEKALFTIRNNEEGNMRLLWAVRRYVPQAHIIKLGSFGEYAKGGIPVAEGYFKPAYRGINASDDLPYPRAANDIYHISKINDSNYVGMAARMWNLRITEVMQSTVFGILTEEMADNPKLCTRFDYDPFFGTVANRFVTQAVNEIPLTIYGNGHQRTGLMALPDAVNSLARFVREPAEPGEHRVINHITETEYSVSELAKDIIEVAFEVGIVSSSINLGDVRNENADVKASYDVESSLRNDAAFHSNFRDVIRQTIEVLRNDRKCLHEDYLIPSVSWGNLFVSSKNVSNEQSRHFENQNYWESIRIEHFDSSQLNLNPGCLGTLAVPVGGSFSMSRADELRGNPLALYAASRSAYRQIRKECGILWPSPGYRLAVTYSTSQNMNLLALAMLRKLQENRRGPFNLVTSRHEHQGGIGPFEQLPEYSVYYLDDDVLGNSRRLIAELQVMQPDVILLSHTYYDTGNVSQDNVSLQVIKDAVPQAWLILDVAQSLGIHPIPVGVADLITGSAHKWLFGPYGSGLTWFKHSFADWLGALFWNDQQLFEEEDTYGFSLPGGQDFRLYEQLQHSLELYRKIGPDAIWRRSCELGDFLRQWLTKLFTDAGIVHCFTSDDPSPCLVLIFADYDPYPLYIHLHGNGIHIKCINQRKFRGEVVNILRIGIPYYETHERLSRFLSEIEFFINKSQVPVTTFSIVEASL